MVTTLTVTDRDLVPSPLDFFITSGDPAVHFMVNSVGQVGGTWEEHSRCITGTWLAYYWHMAGALLAHSRCITGTWLAYYWHMAGVLLAHGMRTTSTWQAHNWHVAGVLLAHGRRITGT